MPPPTLYAIGLGSNRRHGRHGQPAAVIVAAIAALAEAGLTVRAVSPVIRTPALGPAGRAFANAALIAASDLPPPALLALLKRTERAFGRRRGRRWGPRVLDLDILLWSGGRWPRARGINAGHLRIPHPGLPARDFALRPLAAIAPDWRVPGLAATVRQLRARLLSPAPRLTLPATGHRRRVTRRITLAMGP